MLDIIQLKLQVNVLLAMLVIILIQIQITVLLVRGTVKIRESKNLTFSFSGPPPRKLYCFLFFLKILQKCKGNFLSKKKENNIFLSRIWTVPLMLENFLFQLQVPALLAILDSFFLALFVFLVTYFLGYVSKLFLKKIMTRLLVSLNFIFWIIFFYFETVFFKNNPFISPRLIFGSETNFLGFPLRIIPNNLYDN